jgi:hypothetical protein
VTKSKNLAALRPIKQGKEMRGWWFSSQLREHGPVAYVTGAWVVARDPQRRPIRALCKSHNAAVTSAKRYIKNWKPMKREQGHGG